MQEFSTPMMRQYIEIKKQYPDCLLFFRMGDFYELFMEDAHLGSRILSITLTGKAGGKDGKIPMAGVPYHAADTYIAKLVKAGYKVAICEQLSPPNKRGLVKRGVVRIVTPGTLLDEQSLERKENNYIVAIATTVGRIGLAVADISTGYFALFETDSQDATSIITNELTKLQPSECILPDDLYNDTEFLKVLTLQKQMNIFPSKTFAATTETAAKTLMKHFSVSTLEAYGVAEYKTAHLAGAALILYLKETQNGHISHIKKIVSLMASDGLLLDRSTMINLELFSTIRDHDTRGSLLSVMDHTITPMGGRLLKNWLKKPLTEKELIEERLDSVREFHEHPELREAIREQLKAIPDIERLLSRLSVQLGNARDIVHLQLALTNILRIKNLMEGTTAPLLRSNRDSISPDLEKIAVLIERIFVKEPPLSTRNGGMIRSGVSSALDTLKDSILNSKEWIKDLERQERKRTGISSLKVKFNKIFGFYIEVSKANLALVPDDYMRKQTLVNAERFITKALKHHEEIILTAEEKINELEYKIFSETLLSILSYTESIQSGSESIAVIDCLTSFSFLSERSRYVRPKLLYSGEIRIKQGRHPVVEKIREDAPFVPNDVTLDNTSQSLLIITGPNMAGKSVFLRQVALIVLMAQMGCYVPAASAHISIVDRIFVRSGASDVITSGLSTFMVEMVETAHILHNATEKSLIIMDEIGRGTSTYDGISIAWAVAEHFVTAYDSPPKVLFATHYHELQTLASAFPSHIRNFHMAVTERDGEPIFLHDLLPGGAPHSFGVAVAKMAGAPESVIERAKVLLRELEKRSEETPTHNPQNPSPLKKTATTGEKPDHPQDSTLLSHFLYKELKGMDIATMTPLEALNTLASLKENVTLIQKELSFIEKD